jgi:hypothetical protein
MDAIYNYTMGNINFVKKLKCNESIVTHLKRYTNNVSILMGKF